MPIKRSYNKDFFKKWTSDMSYVLGFLFADGNLTRTKRNSHFIAIYSSDREILEMMRTCFVSDHKISIRNISAGRVYRMQIGSIEWFNDLGRLGLIPGKMRLMNPPVIPKMYFGDFVRGYFDGDGNVWSGNINKHRIHPTHVIGAAFTSASKIFLEALRNRLTQAGLIGGSIYEIHGKKCTRLSYSTRDTLKLYEIMYTKPHALFLSRKKAVFERFIKMRP